MPNLGISICVDCCDEFQKRAGQQQRCPTCQKKRTEQLAAEWRENNDREYYFKTLYHKSHTPNRSRVQMLRVSPWVPRDQREDLEDFTGRWMDNRDFVDSVRNGYMDGLVVKRGQNTFEIRNKKMYLVEAQ